MLSTLPILAVCRTLVTYEPSKIALLTMSSRTCSSVDRASAQCFGGHGFDSHCRLRFFFVPRSQHTRVLNISSFTFRMKHGGLMVSALDSRSSDLGLNPNQDHSFVCFNGQDTFLVQCVSLPGYNKWVQANRMLGYVL